MPCYNVEFTMTVTIQAENHEEAENMAMHEAEAQLTRDGMGCLTPQPAEETNCDA